MDGTLSVTRVVRYRLVWEAVKPSELEGILLRCTERNRISRSIFELNI
jgi:hypothetical protein